MAFLARTDPEAFFTVIIFLIVGINIVAQIIRRVKAQRREEREEGAGRPAPREEGGRRPAPKSDLERFLEELSRQAGGARRPRPAPPQAPKPTAERRVITVAPAPAAAKRTRPIPPRVKRPVRRVKAKAPPPPVEGESVVKGLVAKKKRAVRRPGDLAAQAAAPITVSRVEPKKESAAERMEKRLPKDALKRAVLLREILGPCRAQARYRPRSW